jgi:hypothetical protein
LQGVFAMERGWSEFWHRVTYAHQITPEAGRVVLNASVAVTKRAAMA